MKTLVVAIEKGGQGKTFTTCHLAFDAAERGLRVAVIDLDTQGNASYTLQTHSTDFTASELFADDVKALTSWLERLDAKSNLTLIRADREGLAALQKMELSKAATALQRSLAALADHFDVCVIDTPPAVGTAMSCALLVADYLLSPLEMEAYSVEGVGHMADLVAKTRAFNPKLQFIGMFANKLDVRKPRHVATLEALRGSAKRVLLPFSIGARDSIAEALGERMPVWRIRKTAARKATKEVRAMAQHVFSSMGVA